MIIDSIRKFDGWLVKKWYDPSVTTVDSVNKFGLRRYFAVPTRAIGTEETSSSQVLYRCLKVRIPAQAIQMTQDIRRAENNMIP